MASLIVISGERSGEFLPLGKRITVVGRAESLPLQILDDLVSRRHLRVRFDKDADKYYAEDMGSKHGTFINLRKIMQESVLVEGDEILIGQTKLLFTNNDFDTRESALMHWKKVGEKSRTTRLTQAMFKVPAGNNITLKWSQALEKLLSEICEG